MKLVPALAAGFLACAAPVAAGEIRATAGPMGLGSLVNGMPGGGCFSGLCTIQGGTSAGTNLFHRFSAFDTRGGISGVNLDVGGHHNVMVGVTHPLGSFIDTTIRLNAPANLVWLSPGGIRLGDGGGFINTRQLTLSTATGLRLGDGHFDVFGTTAEAARSLVAPPVEGRSGLQSDPASLRQLGLTAQGDLSLDGGLLTVDSSLLLDAQGGHLLLQGARLEAPGGRVDLQGRQVALTGSSVDVSSGRGSGGTISVSGDRVSLAATRLLASGGAGGGRVLVGGGLRGANPAIPNALETSVDAASSLRADASGAGSGGSVVVYAREHAAVHGALSARGGPAGGDGGLVETSAARLEVTSSPDLTATAGRGGTWLVDPFDIEIYDPALPPASVGGGSVSRIDVNALNACLNLGCSFTLETTSSEDQARNIYLNAGIRKDAGGDSAFTLLADGDIFLNVPGSGAAAIANTSPGGRLDVNLRHRQTDGPSPPPAGATHWQNGAIDLGAGTLRLTRGPANEPGRLVLEGSGNTLALRSGTLQAGALGWDPASNAILQVGSSATDASLQLESLTTSSTSSIQLLGSGASSLSIAAASFLNAGLIGGGGTISIGNGSGSFSHGAAGLSGGRAILTPAGSLQIRADSLAFADSGLLRLNLSRGDQLTVFGEATLGGALLVDSPPTVSVPTSIDLLRARRILGGFAPGAIDLPALVRLDGVTLTSDPLLPAVLRGAVLPSLPAPVPPAAQTPAQAAVPAPAAQALPFAVPASVPFTVPDPGYQIFQGTQTAPSASSLMGWERREGSGALAVNLSEADFSLATEADGLPGPLATTTTTMGQDQVAIAISTGDQQRGEDVRNTLGDVGAPEDAPRSLRVDELQQLLLKASRKGDGEDERFNPAVLMVAFSEGKHAVSASGDGIDRTKPNAFLDLILLSRRGEPLGSRVELSRERFGEQLRALYRQLARLEPLGVDDPTSPSRQLHRAIIGPVAAELERRGITTLVIVADRGLQALPFAALHDGTTYFGDRYGFSLTPSLSLTSLGPPRRTRGRVLAAGASEFESLSPLPLVKEELAGIPEGVGVDRFLNRSFTPQVLLTQAADSRYERIHVATHAEFLPGGPEQARIYTGTDPVSLGDFSRLRQQRRGGPLELFVLSACRTALGDADSELGFAGLALQAGSRSAVGTLWYVDDVATSAYFLQLYRYLDQGMQKAEALRATRRAMASGTLRLQGDRVIGSDGQPLLSSLSTAQQRRIARGMSHPYFWAGVQLIGTPW